MIWDLFEGRHMFYGEDPDGRGYSTRAHLAEVIALLGPPPLDLIKRGARSDEFFTKNGKWRNEVPIAKPTTLEDNENFLEGKNKEKFIKFVRAILQWRPEDRKTAKELLQDPWLNSPWPSTRIKMEIRLILPQCFMMVFKGLESIFQS